MTPVRFFSRFFFCPVASGRMKLPKMSVEDTSPHRSSELSSQSFPFYSKLNINNNVAESEKHVSCGLYGICSIYGERSALSGFLLRDPQIMTQDKAGTSGIDTIQTDQSELVQKQCLGVYDKQLHSHLYKVQNKYTESEAVHEAVQKFPLVSSLNLLNWRMYQK